MVGTRTIREYTRTGDSSLILAPFDVSFTILEGGKELGLPDEDVGTFRLAHGNDTIAMRKCGSRYCGQFDRMRAGPEYY